MRVVLWAGGKGSRLHGHDAPIPKPMTLIHKKPMLEHVMGIYQHFGYNDFVICMGFRKEKIVEWAKKLNGYGLTIELDGKKVPTKRSSTKLGSLILVDTGELTETGGRTMRAAQHLGKEFMATYGDGLGDVNIGKLADYHHSHGHMGTVTTHIKRTKNRFGRVESEFPNGKATSFEQFDERPANIGFFVLKREALDMKPDDGTSFEEGVALPLQQAGQLYTFRHNGYWQGMDTPEDLEDVRSRHMAGVAPWKFAEAYTP